MKIDTALYNNEKKLHRYFNVDTRLSRDLASAFWPLCVSYAPAYGRERERVKRGSEMALLLHKKISGNSLLFFFCTNSAIHLHVGVNTCLAFFLTYNERNNTRNSLE